ncbi:hypothetical protein F5141DRAFT_835906 [Pisolithus sp. B1]|nr:hypothetical protein F5141DRAFT_835906 [Pisolithus sp. B1]
MLLVCGLTLLAILNSMVYGCLIRFLPSPLLHSPSGCLYFPPQCKIRDNALLKMALVNYICSWLDEMTPLMVAGAVLVFEYLYFLLQARNGRQDLQEDLTSAVEQYQSSGTCAKVNTLIQEAFEKYGDNVDVLCPILVHIAQQNQLSKMLNHKG